MAKDGILGNLSNISSIIVSIVAIILLLMLVTGKIDLSDTFSTTIDQTTYKPSQMVDCSYYNIADEHRNAYGDAVIDKLMSNCLDVGGTWTETNKEMSCYWNPAITTIDCDSQMINVLTEFCEDSLLAKYTCDNGLAYAGCHCNKLLPSAWVVEEEDDYDWGENESYTPVILCPDVELPAYGDLGGICRADGWCPDDTQTCSHYWDFNNQKHRCDCSDTYFCPQMCFLYSFQTGCECPPNSYRVQVDRTNHQCIPTGCICNNGNVVC